MLLMVHDCNLYLLRTSSIFAGAIVYFFPWPPQPFVDLSKEGSFRLARCRSFTLRNALAGTGSRASLRQACKLHAARARLIPFPLVLVLLQSTRCCTWYATIRDILRVTSSPFSFCTRIASGRTLCRI